MKRILLVIIILSFLIACIDRPRRGDVTIYNQEGKVVDTYIDVKIICDSPIIGVEFEMNNERFHWTEKYDVFYKERIRGK